MNDKKTLPAWIKKYADEVVAENKQLREVLFEIASNKYSGKAAVIVAHRALMKLPDVPKLRDGS